MRDGVSKLGWASALFGIPLSVLLTWAFTAGGLCTDVAAAKGMIELHTTDIHRLDTRITVMEELFKKTHEDISEIKSMLKERAFRRPDHE